MSTKPSNQLDWSLSTLNIVNVLLVKVSHHPQVNRHLERYIALLEDAKERDAVREMLAISRLGNQVKPNCTIQITYWLQWGK